MYFYNLYFNSVVRKQNKDCKSIPIIIISYNQLFCLQKLISFLKTADYNNIVIIDNNSNYPPLLKYFDEIEKDVKIHRLYKNYGHRVFWKQTDLYQKYAKGYYVVTDPDIVPINDCPADFMNVFKKYLDENPEVNKVGFSLRIDDIPNSNKEKQTILKWEKQFWKKQDINANYIAKIDTTFALYRPKNILGIWLDFFKAIRVKYPYIAKHGGWYVDSNNLTEEQEYYIKTVNKSSSWLNFKGDSKLKKYKS